jgi:hypothetical protein
MIGRTSRRRQQVIEVVVARDPDGPTVFSVVIDGVRCPAIEFIVDAGAGWTWPDWTEARDTNLGAASPAARAILLEHYRRPLGGEHVTGRGDEGWLDGVL